jgi:hypothetical protein
LAEGGRLRKVQRLGIQTRIGQPLCRETIRGSHGTQSLADASANGSEVKTCCENLFKHRHCPQSSGSLRNSSKP